MKKIGIVLSFMMIFAVGAAQAQSQKLQKGVRVGINIATLAGSSVHNASSKLGFSGNFFLTYNFTNYFAFQPEVGVAFLGAKGNPLVLGGNTSNQYDNNNTSYVEVPVLARFTLSDSPDFSPAILVGPSFGLNISNSYHVPTTANNLYQNPNAKFITVGIVGGITANIQRFVLDARYDYGLSSAYNTPSSARNTAIIFTVGFLF